MLSGLSEENQNLKKNSMVDLSTVMNMIWFTTGGEWIAIG
jgi:uncharacterized membrane protein YccF (DUF307 family)